MSKISTPHDLPSVETLSDVTPESFARDILPAARPVLIKGLMAKWPAVTQGLKGPEAMASYLKAMDRGQPTTVLESYNTSQGHFTYSPDMSDFNFTKRFKSISAGLDQLLNVLEHPNPPYIYIQSTVIQDYLPVFLKENVSPLLPPAIQPRIWISNGTTAQTHNDNDHNLACVVAGRRRFTLFPPEQLPNLYIGPMDHTPSGRAISLVNLEQPDFDKFPKFREALESAQVAEMEPGDALYVPKYWWHHVKSLTPFNVLVNYWWGNSANTVENPMSAFLSALLSLKDIPANDKAYWKAMFDHYIFQMEGDPMPHIPLANQGGLGRQTAKQRAEIFAALKALIDGRG
jgi:hypothetical protein